MSTTTTFSSFFASLDPLPIHLVHSFFLLQRVTKGKGTRQWSFLCSFTLDDDVDDGSRLTDISSQKTMQSLVSVIKINETTYYQMFPSL